MRSTTWVDAAGAVVWRDAGRTLQVLLVHRPKYDDWSFPKGKLDPAEHPAAAGVREVAEETGLQVRLGLPLPGQEYPVSNGTAKRVRYWAARPVGDSSVESYEPNHEVDDVRWLPLADASARLTYARDGALLAAFAREPYRSEPLLVLRHAHALDRRSWPGPDAQRGLAPDGEAQAKALAPLLAAYGVRGVVSSDSVRCTATVAPFARAAGLSVETAHALSEEGTDPSALDGLMRARLTADEPVVVCSHRPVLPRLLSCIGLDDAALRPGELVVAHRTGTRVHATERHQA